MPGLCVCELELALKISEGHIDVAHGHAWVDVPKYFHQDWEADAGAKHFRSVCMAELVWNDARGEAQGVADPMEVIAQLNNDGHFRS